MCLPLHIGKCYLPEAYTSKKSFVCYMANLCSAYSQRLSYVFEPLLFWIFRICAVLYLDGGLYSTYVVLIVRVIIILPLLRIKFRIMLLFV